MEKATKKIKKYFLLFSLGIAALSYLTFLAYKEGRLSISPEDNKILVSPTPSQNSGKSLKTYSSSYFPYKFKYPAEVAECPQGLTVSPPWLMGTNTYGMNLYCVENSNLVQVITEKTDKDTLSWWYSLLKDNKPFFDKYGSEKDTSFAGQKAIQISYRKETNEHYDQVEIIFAKDGINYLIVGLNYFCSENNPCWMGDLEKQVISSFELVNLGSTGQTTKTKAPEFCGGIAAIPCPKGYSCQLDGNYPDASGKCVKK